MSCKLRTWKKAIRAAKIEEKNLLKPVKSKTNKNQQSKVMIAASGIN